MDKTNPPLFSIITITRNNRSGLKKTFLSIRTQTNTNFEWIIIDGASTDGTKDDLKDIAADKIISEQDSGIYDAMNKGLQHAIGEYVIFMNAGDMFASPNVLENISALTRSKPDFIYGDSLESNHYKPARSHLKINWGMFTHHQAMFYQRESLGQLRYDMSYKIAADYNLTLRFLSFHKRVLYRPIPICIFESGGISQTQADLGRKEQYLSRKQNKSCSDFQNHLIQIIQMFRFKFRKVFPSLYWLSIRF